MSDLVRLIVKMKKYYHIEKVANAAASYMLYRSRSSSHEPPTGSKPLALLYNCTLLGTRIYCPFASKPIHDILVLSILLSANLPRHVIL
jgi:hypothetical protein